MEKENYINNNNINIKLKKLYVFFETQTNIKNQPINSEITETYNESEIAKKGDEQEDHIYLKYLKNNNIIFENKDINNENFKLIVNELNNDIDNGNNIILPFLDIAPNLVKFYIESDIDNYKFEEDTPGESNIQIQSFYQNFFQKLKYNCFINKEPIMHIYNYFSNLYHNVEKIKEKKRNNKENIDDDLIQLIKLLKKFNKLTNLFKIFYEKGNKKNGLSSICSIGGNLKILLNKPLLLSEGYELLININISDYYLEDINKDLYIIKINEFEQKYECLFNNIENNNKFNNINFSINSKMVYTEFKTNKRKMKIMESFELNEISEIYILENFFGQISSIDISIQKEGKIIEYNFLPISIRNENKIYYYRKTFKGENIKELSNIVPRIIVCNTNLVKINYLNFIDKNFDIIDYFGGVIQFLPFYNIFYILCDKNIIKINDDINQIKGNISNDSITVNKSNENSPNKILGEHIKLFITFLLKIILKKLFSTNNKKNYFKKYAIFIFSLILNIDIDLDFINEDKKTENNKQNDLSSFIELLTMIYYNYKNAFSFDVKQEINFFLNDNGTKNEIQSNILKLPKKSVNQLYTHYMKKLFIFNNLWSKKNIFFKKNEDNNNNKQSKEIKYRQINYYTKNFQLPYFYPILELRKYYPKFSKLKDGIFLGQDNDILEYNFEFQEGKSTILLNAISEIENKEIKDISQECCLVKNSYHVSGKLIFKKKKEYNKNKKFTLIFKQGKNDFKTCNKHFLEQNKKDNKKESNYNNALLCYGSVFPTPEKEIKKSIIIKSKDIKFILYRIYFHRTSAIEIFTMNNKSYYFNFFRPFETNNLKKNEILKEIKSNSYFKEMKLKKERIVLGLYNSIYESYLFPLFKDEINNWEKKINYLSNYDILIIINIFSNRSYRDIYQFPIFPTIYNWICQKRDMSQHIGLQEIYDETKARRRTIIKCYESKMDEETKNKGEEVYLFNIHYSNPAFTFNYLLRVLPYSFLAVEFQGDDFDNSNRLFYSIEKSLRSNLILKSDLREMIPELFYMVELYYNKNNLLFDNLYDGSGIDYVEIIPKDNEKSQTEREKKQTIVEYIIEMRKYLEVEKDLHQWINLIFGKRQKKSFCDNKKYQNYEKSREVSFKYDPNIIENPYYMELADFGLLPFQLFNNDFQKKDFEEKKRIDLEIRKLNLELFKEEHISKINSPLECFICKGSTLLNNNYIKLVDQKENVNILDYYEFPVKYIQKLNIKSLNNHIFKNIIGTIDINEKKPSNYSYLNNFYFVGNIYGTVNIYSLLNSKKDKKEEEEEEKEELIEKYGSFEVENDDNLGIIKNSLNKESNSSKLKEKEYSNYIKKEGNIIPILKNNKKIFEFEMKLIKQLHDHSKEIKYIDFNPRLNILLTYSLDGFINLYIFPKLKLINVIDTTSFKEKNDLNYFDEVVLISYPFPMIICHTKEYIYSLTINGDYIKNEKLKENHSVNFIIDKNLGSSEDLVEISDSKGKHAF